MANLVTGAMGSLITKLGKLLKEEYNLQTGMKKRIKSLTEELESAQAALRKVEMAPWDQLDELVQIWARQVREASYDMEDVLDIFLVCVKSPNSTKQKSLRECLGEKITNLFTKSKARHEISVNTKDIMRHLEEVTERCRRYQVGDIAVAMPNTASTVDPRLHAMYNKVQDLVGMEKSSRELISKLQPLQRDGASNLKMKIVSIVGVGGLGKTTLAKAVYDKIKGDFNFSAFVPVGRNPDLKKIFKDILIDLDKQRYLMYSTAALDERQLIDDLHRFFLEHKKRYLIVIDDIWEVESWKTIKFALDNDNDFGGRIIITTRKLEVATKADEVYKLQHLPYDSSRELFLRRISGHEGKYIHNQQDEILDKFIRKCSGIPLAIITMASLLAGKQREEWPELYNTIDFVSKDNNEAENTMKILSFSYYDLPVHLRTCLLYLSAFPEDSVIPKDSLVWMWVAEGFVEEKQGMRLFQAGEGYFHDLINRSMLEAVKSRHDDSIVTGCRVHDIVLDFIRSMSDQANFFSIALESNNVPRRLAQHNRTMGYGHRQGDDLKMEKLRSLFFIRCGIEALYPFHRFTLLRVLVIDNCKGSFIFGNEHLRHLLHLRFLGIRGTSVERIPEEIGRLRFLQSLDLENSILKEFPSPESLPEQLVSLCLPISYGTTMHSNDAIFSMTRLTKLEELSLSSSKRQAIVRWHLPTELKVLKLSNIQDSWEYVGHLNKLEHLTVCSHFRMTVTVTDFDLPRSLHHMDLGQAIVFWKLPSCFNVSCLPKLSHLDLSLEDLDEHDLKMLGRLPELRYLGLGLWTPDKVSSVVVVSEKDAAVVYFPKLRCFELRYAMVTIIANEESKSISFHLWKGGRERYIGMPSVSEDKLQRPIQTGGSGGGANTSATGGALRDRFMPCLQMFHFALDSSFRWHEYYRYRSLGFEYGLPSLLEIGVEDRLRAECCDEIRAALRSEARTHPNRPAFRDGPWW